MIKKIILPFCISVLSLTSAYADMPLFDEAKAAVEQYQQKNPNKQQPIQYICKVVGIKKSDNITTFEFNPANSVIDNKGGVSSTMMTLKYYKSFNKNYNAGIELPFGRFESPDKSVNGLGDILISAGARGLAGGFSSGIILDLTLPSGRSMLSDKKVILAPETFAEYTFNNNIFFAGAYKHYVSIAGDGNRPDINKGRIKVDLGYQSDTDWWVMLEPQYYIYYNDNWDNEFYFEVEAGAMVKEYTSIYFKPGRHISGAMKSKDWGLSFGVRIHNI